ncbi:MAG: helix-turn-helix domain-containing protein [Acidobacteria bacterium]|nr:helix-turn-helix domain-containing protein [Acidobacteriota bacterium]
MKATHVTSSESSIYALATFFSKTYPLGVPTLGEVIAELRKEAGFPTQVKLAKALGRKSQIISDWENDRRGALALPNLMAVAVALRVTVDDILIRAYPDYHAHVQHQVEARATAAVTVMLSALSSTSPHDDTQDGHPYGTSPADRSTLAPVASLARNIQEGANGEPSHDQTRSDADRITTLEHDVRVLREACIQLGLLIESHAREARGPHAEEQRLG